MVDDKTKENLNKPSSDKDVLKRWKKIGFLQGLDGEMELKTAWAFENMALTLVLSEITYSKWFKEVIFPIIRRTMSEYYEKHNEVKVIETNDYFEFFKSHTLSDIINNDYWNYDSNYKETKENIIETKHIFSKIFEVISPIQR